MKIFHVISSLKVGGAESALSNFLSFSQNNPHEHAVAYFHTGPNVDRLNDIGIELHHIKGLFCFFDPLAFWRLVRLIQRSKPDVIHSALWSANIIGRVIAYFLDVPIVCDVHGNSFDEGRIRNFFDRLTASYATKIIAVSNVAHQAYCLNIMSSKKNVQHQKKVITIKNGIDCQTIRTKALQVPFMREEFGLLNNHFVIGAVGRLERIKSYDLLIKACAQVIACKPCMRDRLRVVIVGDGSERGMLAGLISDFSLSQNIFLVGSYCNAVRFYPLFDCFVLTSQSEGLSIALLEALCFGLPIISTHPASQLHDVITHGVHGLLIPPNDVFAIAQAIISIEGDEERRRYMRIVNRELVEDDFSLDVMARAYHAVYEKAVPPSACRIKSSL